MTIDDATLVGDETGRDTSGAGASATDEEGLPSRGDSIGRYVVLDRIGAGAIGMVYAAYDPDLDRRVAIKLLRRRGADGQMMREAQAVARVVHPNVVGVHDVGLWRERVFVAMELVDGTTLTQWLRGAERSALEIIATFVQAGRGLAAAHAVGIVHRDFKPDNVLVTPSGVHRDIRVRVADFGLARATELRASTDALPTVPRHEGTPLQVTATGGLLGTPAYMAPEQHTRMPCTPASDQFSFCVALWEALFGARPFVGETFAALAVNVLEGRIAAPTDPGRAPRRVREALLRGLATEPAARHASMDELLAVLEHALAGKRRRWLAVAFVGLGSALGFGVREWASADGAAPCAAEAAPIAAVWNEATAQSLRDTFTATGLEWAPVAAHGVTQRLDVFAAQWRARWVELCAADRAAGEHAEPAIARRLECLDDRRREAAAAVELLLAGDERTVEQAFDVLGGVREVEPCMGDEALRQRSRSPPASLLVEVGAIRDELARVTALGHAGANAEATALRAELATRAAALAWRHIELEVEVVTARLGSVEQTLPLMRAAFDDALELDDPGLAARFAVELAWDTGHRARDLDEGLAWVATAHALQVSAGGEWLLGVSVINTGAVLESGRGNHARAAELFREAIAIADLHDTVGMHASRLRANLASHYGNLGELEAALVEQTAALAGLRAVVGDVHPRIAELEANLALLYGARGDFVEAEAHVVEAERSAAADPYMEEQTRLQIATARCEIAVAGDRHVEAAELLREMIASAQRGAGSPTQPALFRGGLIRELLRQPAPDRVEIERLLAEIEGDPQLKDWHRARSMSVTWRGEHALAFLADAELPAVADALGVALEQVAGWSHLQALRGHAIAIELALRMGDTESARRWLDGVDALDPGHKRDQLEEAQQLLRLARVQRVVDPQSPRARAWLELARARIAKVRGDSGRVGREIDRALEELR